VVSSLQAKGATGQGRTDPFLERELVRAGGTPPLVAARSFDQAELVRAIRAAVRFVYSRAASKGSGVEQREGLVMEARWKRVSVDACRAKRKEAAAAYKIIGCRYASRLVPVYCSPSPSRARTARNTFFLFLIALPIRLGSRGSKLVHF
jgi:hypothetical protein